MLILSQGDRSGFDETVAVPYCVIPERSTDKDFEVCFINEISL